MLLESNCYLEQVKSLACLGGVQIQSAWFRLHLLLWFSFRCCVICEVPDDEAEAVVYELPHQFHILRWESLKILVWFKGTGCWLLLLYCVMLLPW